MREEEAGDQIKKGQKAIQTPDTDVLVEVLRSWMWDAMDMIKSVLICGAPLFETGRGDWRL